MELCNKKKTKEELKRFRKAIEHDYLFLMHIDDLPIRFALGRLEKGNFFFKI
jgi:hypothetical protein